MSNPTENQGLKLLGEGKYQEALDFFNEFLKAHPRDADAYGDRGVVRLHLDDLEGALDDMNHARSLEPKKAYRYSSRAFVKEKMGDTRGAILDYEKAIQLGPEDAIAHNNLGLLEEKLGRHNKALEHIRKADKLGKPSDAQIIESGLNTYEQNKVVNELLTELKIDTKEAQVHEPTSFSKRALIKTALTAFFKPAARKEYFQFLKNLFKSKNQKGKSSSSEST